MAADSRWTHDDESVEDGAVKVFQLGPNAVMGYTGAAGLGEDLLLAIEQNRARTITIAQYHRQTQTILQNVWRGHNQPAEVVNVMVGLSTNSKALLSHFSSTDHFEPHEVQDMVVVGPERAKDYLEQCLRAAIYEVNNGGRLPDSIDTWAALVIGMITEVCDLAIHASVGGLVSAGYSIFGEAHGARALQVLQQGNGIALRDLSLRPLGAKMVRRAWTI